MCRLFDVAEDWLTNREKAFGHELLVTLAEVNAQKQKKQSTASTVKKWMKVGEYTSHYWVLSHSTDSDTFSPLHHLSCRLETESLLFAA